MGVPGSSPALPANLSQGMSEFGEDVVFLGDLDGDGNSTEFLVGAPGLRRTAGAAFVAWIRPGGIRASYGSTPSPSGLIKMVSVLPGGVGLASHGAPEIDLTKVTTIPGLSAETAPARSSLSGDRFGASVCTLGRWPSQSTGAVVGIGAPGPGGTVATGSLYLAWLGSDGAATRLKRLVPGETGSEMEGMLSSLGGGSVTFGSGCAGGLTSEQAFLRRRLVAEENLNLFVSADGADQVISLVVSTSGLTEGDVLAWRVLASV